MRADVIILFKPLVDDDLSLSKRQVQILQAEAMNKERLHSGVDTNVFFCPRGSYHSLFPRT